MAFKLPPITVLPGGRKVRDYDHLTVEAMAEQKAAEEAAAAKEAKKAEKAAAKKQAEDESLG